MRRICIIRGESDINWSFYHRKWHNLGRSGRWERQASVKSGADFALNWRSYPVLSASGVVSGLLPSRQRRFCGTYSELVELRR
jgi:hypothetical protein